MQLRVTVLICVICSIGRYIDIKCGFTLLTFQRFKNVLDYFCTEQHIHVDLRVQLEETPWKSRL